MAERPQLTVWQIIMLFLSVYVLVALAADTFFRLPGEVSALIGMVDTWVCVVFLGDFAYQLVAAESKARYLKWGWLDLVSSIPNLEILRLGRFARVVRILRLLRGVRSAKVILAHLFANRARGTLTTVAMATFVLMLFASVAILSVETDPAAKIRTADDAPWWATNTVTTIGYGDVYPTSTTGRVIAVLLMVAGVGLFGTFTASVASLFNGHQQEAEQEHRNELLAAILGPQRRLDGLEGRLPGGPAPDPEAQG